MEQLKEGQRIVFTIKDKNYKYEVCTNYLQKLEGGYNDKIFLDLKLDTKKFANSAYGYDSDEGDWPESRFEDFAALTRLVKALFPYCDKVTVDGNIVYSKSEKTVSKEPESSDIIDFESIVKSQTIKLVFI